MTAVTALASLALWLLPANAQAMPEEMVLSCRLCGDDAGGVLLASRGGRQEARLERELNRLDREIGRASASKPFVPIALGVGGGCITLVSPFLFMYGLIWTFETGDMLWFVMGITSFIVGPILVGAAVVWAAIGSKKRSKRVHDLQRQRSRLERELHDLRRRENELPPVPMVPVATIRF